MLASVLVDDAIAAAMMPFACPCDFGPSARYRLEELIGVGHASLVYRAHDRVLSSEGFDATVAIKVMRSGAVENEALTARRVTHLNVLSVLDRGVDNSGYSYMVVEHVDGGDLSQRPVPWAPGDAARFVSKVAAGVQAAHSAGVIHCDLKPSNILLTKEGEPKVGDFDLASSPLSPGLGFRGNLAFMSPEQFAGDENAISPPSDVYALGGILYFLVTGKLPHGANHEDVKKAHAVGGPPVRREIQGDLGRICARALAPQRTDRYHSAGSLAEDLQRCLAHEPLPWTKPAWPRRAWLLARRRPYLMSALVLIVGLGGTSIGVIGYNRVQERRRELQAQAEANRIAAEQIETTRQKLQAIIESVYKAAFVNPSGDLVDRMLPALVWLDFMSGLPVVSPEGRVALSSERVAGLRQGLAALVAQGRGEHVDAMLMRYSLAYFLINDGDDTEAPGLIDDLEEHWLPKLASDDPMIKAVAFLRIFVNANTALKPGGDIPGAIAQVETMEHDLRFTQQWVPIQHLAHRILGRLRKALPPMK
jgi:hypothetical protein